MKNIDIITNFRLFGLFMIVIELMTLVSKNQLFVVRFIDINKVNSLNIQRLTHNS